MVQKKKKKWNKDTAETFLAAPSPLAPGDNKLLSPSKTNHWERCLMSAIIN